MMSRIRTARVAILVAAMAMPAAASAQQTEGLEAVRPIASASAKEIVVFSIDRIAVRATVVPQRLPAPSRQQHAPMPFELLVIGAAATAKRARKRAGSGEPEGSAVDKPDYDEKGQPQPTAPNRTDAEGVDSNWQPPAGVDPTAATPHTTPEVTDPGFQRRRQAEAALRGEEIAKKDRAPQVLTGGLDVRRGEKVYRIPAGTVVEEVELTDEEWDQVVKNGLVREASYSEVVASKQQAERAEHDAKMLELQKKNLGVKPKKASGDKPPAGAHLVADLEAGAAEVANAQVARAIARREFERGTTERASMLSGKAGKSK